MCTSKLKIQWTNHDLFLNNDSEKNEELEKLESAIKELNQIFVSTPTALNFTKIGELFEQICDFEKG